jgi:hypothetical protein
MSETAIKPSYGPHDVLSPDEVRAALPEMADNTWASVKARIPWSDALGPRKLCIQWARLLTWLESHERRVA